MIIKKFQGNTETEAIMLAKDNLGKDAIVMNIKTVKPKGLFKMFRKTLVEVTAAVDEISSDKKEDNANTASGKINASIDEKLHPNYRLKNESEKVDKDKELEDRLNSLAMLLEEQIESSKHEKKNQKSKDKKNSKTSDNIIDDKKTSSNITSERNVSQNNIFESKKFEEDQYDDSDDNILKEKSTFKEKSVNLIIEQLTNNEVSYKYATQIIDEIMHAGNVKTLDEMLARVYQKIILKLGQTNTIGLSSDDKRPKVIFFVGPTGVGKTTTIAKLSSKLVLEGKNKIAIFTSDTYRIAAVEQIKTYANILSIPVEVIYETKDINYALPKYSEYDYILVDTAGRSHKNEKQVDDLKSLFEAFSDYSMLTYLVLSATTKYKDLQKITKLYDDITDCSLVFTKLDETDAIGNILNVKLDTGMSLSYVSYGQNVPDDIEVMNPQIVAKQLLGGGDGYGSGR